jgi:hypothetical protein
MLSCPYIEWRRCNLINQWSSKAEQCEIDTLYVMPARVARFNSDVVVFRAMKVSEFRWSLFAAIRADDASKFPA